MPNITQRFPVVLCVIGILGTAATFGHDGPVADELAVSQILGVLDFPNSGLPEAQDAFERGVMLLHSFEYDDARSACLEAQAAGPGFAMAIWGEAMTFNHPLWLQQDRAAAPEALAKLPPVAGRRASGLRNIVSGNLDAAAGELGRLRERIAGARVLSVEEGPYEDDWSTSEDGYRIATIIARELEGLIAFRTGDTESASTLLAAAAADENARPMEYGPPYVSKPCSELLGEMLLTLDRPLEALAHFEDALARNPGRTLALIGLARAQDASGDPRAAETWSRVETNWKSAARHPRETGYSWLDTGSRQARR